MKYVLTQKRMQGRYTEGLDLVRVSGQNATNVSSLWSVVCLTFCLLFALHIFPGTEGVLIGMILTLPTLPLTHWIIEAVAKSKGIKRVTKIPFN